MIQVKIVLLSVLTVFIAVPINAKDESKTSKYGFQWDSLFPGESYNNNLYIQPIAPLVDSGKASNHRSGHHGDSNQWEPMIIPQSSRNRKVWKTFAASEKIEQTKEPDNKGDESHENVDKRWPLIKDNIESEIFADDWKTERSPILGLTGREPDWTSEDPFSRIDRSAPQISTPIYHRDVEEIRSERQTPHGYDKSISRTSKITWDDKEEYRTTEKEPTLSDNLKQDNKIVSNNNNRPNEPFRPTRITTSPPSPPPQPTAPVSSPAPVTSKPRGQSDARSILGLALERPAKKYVWFEMPNKKPSRSQRLEITTTTSSPQDIFSEIQTIPPNNNNNNADEFQTVPPKKSENKKQTRSPKAPKSAKSRSKSVWGLRKSVSDNQSAALQSVLPTNPPVITTKAPFWSEFETSTVAKNDNVNREWESTSNHANNNHSNKKRNNLRKRKGSTVDVVTNLDVTLPPTTTNNPFFETRQVLPTNRARPKRKQKQSQSSSSSSSANKASLNDGSFSFETSIDHSSGISESTGQRNAKLQTKGGRGERKSSRASPTRRRASSTARKGSPVNFLEEPRQRERLVVEKDIPSETTTTSTLSPTTFQPTTIFRTTTFRPTTIAPSPTTVPPPTAPSTTTTFKSEADDFVTVNGIPGEGMQRAALIQENRNKETEEVTGRLEDVLPGVPDKDYSTFKTVPKTAFRCSDQQYPGYYGDVETKCQVFHICQADGRQDDFICPIGTVFNQMLFVCDWWNNFRCEDSPSYYEMNANIYDYSKDGSTNRTGNDKASLRFGEKMSNESIDQSGKLVTDDNPESEDLPSTSAVYFDEDYKEKSDDNLSDSSRRSGGLEKENDYSTNSENNGNNRKKTERDTANDDVEYYFNDDMSTSSSPSSSSLSSNSEDPIDL